MLVITLIREKSGDGILGFSAKGHAEFAEYGQDVLCSALSALCQAAYLGVDQVAAAENITHIEESGAMDLMLVGGRESAGWAAAQTVLRTLELALRSIEAGYSEYVTINDLWR